MRTNLIKIGNSHGIIIPARVLSACNLGEAVDMQIRDGKIVLEAIKAPREGWFDNYQPQEDEPLLDTIPLDEDDSEWTW